jgi:hypothetical protein
MSNQPTPIASLWQSEVGSSRGLGYPTRSPYLRVFDPKSFVINYRLRQKHPATAFALLIGLNGGERGSSS